MWLPIAFVTLVIVALFPVTTAVARQSAPVLGVTWHALPGFGRVRPRVISFGGDPTSVVAELQWSGWGTGLAVADGKSDWVWPGTCVGCNRPSTVRVVAFHLGACRGRRAYNALEWYFPEYGETFKPGDYTNPCSHRSVDREPAPTSVEFPSLSLSGGATVSYLSAAGISCEAADGLIAQVPEGPFYSEQRLEVAGYRCGTEGSDGSSALSQVWECEVPGQTISYIVEY